MPEILEEQILTGTTKTGAEVLTIQRFIFLLSDFHYQEFIKHLQEADAALPLKLAEAVKQTLPGFDSHAELCTKVYGSASDTDKKKFNQLSVHTFKLSRYLVCNYPDYLSHNINRIEHWVNTGNPKLALRTAKFMLDIAERIEDFRSQIWCLRFLASDAILNKETQASVKYGEELKKVLHTELVYTELQQDLRLVAMDENNPADATAYESKKAYYESFFEHTSSIVRVTAMYGYVSWVYHHNPKYFNDKRDLRVLKELEDKLQQFPHLAFPFMTNMYGNTAFIRLNAVAASLEDKERTKLYNDLEDYYRQVKFTSEYVRDGQLYLIAIECSRLVSTYYQHLHRSDYHTVIKPQDIKSIERKIKTCEGLLAIEAERKSNEIFLANLRMLYGAFYVMAGGEKNIRRGITELETLLTSYQQMSLKASTDSIFMVLAIAYFAVADYEKCLEVYKRYTKVKKNKNIYEGNDEKIYAYYYIAQWILTGREQYRIKLGNVIYRNGKENTTKSLLQLLDLLKIEVTE